MISCCINFIYYNRNLSAADGVPKGLLLMFKLNKTVCANFLVTNSNTLHKFTHSIVCFIIYYLYIVFHRPKLICTFIIISQEGIMDVK